MKKHNKIKMILFIIFSFIFGNLLEEAYSQPDPPGGSPYGSKEYTTIKTPKGEDVEAILFTDVPAWVTYWEAYGAWLISSNGWTATRQAAATHEYNCHGYAWYVSEDGSNGWINNNDYYNDPNLSKYWTGLQSYVTGSTANGRKIHYSNDDHSAITTTNPSYAISKWGRCPLYLHLKADCPYVSTGLVYYQLNPNMTGSTSVLCYNVQRPFNTNITHMTGATLTWTPSGYITYYSGAGTPEYTVKGSGNGDSEVNFQISTPSGFSWSSDKDFYAGKPVPSILGPDEVECYFPEWYFIDSDSYQWGDFEWSTDYMMDILGTTTGHKAEAEGLEEGYGQIFCEVTNTCGSAENRLVVWINCFFFKMAPNPSDYYFEISLDETKVDFSNILEYEVKIYNSQQVLVSNAKTRNSSLQFNTSQFRNGIYYVHLVYNSKTYVRQLVVSH